MQGMFLLNNLIGKFISCFGSVLVLTPSHFGLTRELVLRKWEAQGLGHRQREECMRFHLLISQLMGYLNKKYGRCS